MNRKDDPEIRRNNEKSRKLLDFRNKVRRILDKGDDLAR